MSPRRTRFDVDAEPVNATDDSALHLLAQIQELTKLQQGKKANMDVLASVLNNGGKAPQENALSFEDTTVIAGSGAFQASPSKTDFSDKEESSGSESD